MAYRTPFARARGLGAAKEGVAHWWAQRVTAVALVPLSLWLVASLVALSGAGYAEVAGWLHRPWNAALMLFLVGVTFHHGQLGLQVVVEDYVHSEWLKLAVLLAVKFAALLFGLLAGLAVLRVALGG